MKIISLNTRNRREMVEITSQVNKLIEDEKIRTGFCLVFVPHTTCGVTINENADPSVRADILAILARLAPEKGNYQHGEGNSDAHAASSLVGHSILAPVINGRLALGTWQGIFLCEFDGPRSRQVWVKIIAETGDVS
ncbi:MAG: secondary thiamine-phosphate synthase enzyme YjbQ [Candidatus Omnitrophica bacterium]|nr:secondary thiamine-phosphate synthase enzyme YjbQ [Candidatus Omnitrophota bacterium]